MLKIYKRKNVDTIATMILTHSHNIHVYVIYIFKLRSL